MARKVGFKDHEHDRDSSTGRFTKMNKQKADVPAAPAVDLSAERCTGGPHLKGAAWGEAQIDGIVAKAVAMGHDPDSARKDITKAVCLAAKTYQGVVEDSELKAKMLQMAESEAEKVLLDHYGDVACNGDACGRGDEVLEAVNDQWGEALERYCDDRACDLDGMSVEREKYGPRRAGIEFWVTSLASEGRWFHPSKLGAAGVERPEWDHHERVRNEATGDDLRVKFGATPNGLMVEASFGGFWHLGEVRDIDDGNYDAVFPNLEADIRSDATYR